MNLDSKIISLKDGHRAIFSDIYTKQGLPPLSYWEALKLWAKIPRHLGMANLYSDEWTKVRAGRRVAPYVYGGRAQIIAWDFASLPAGNIGDVLVCGKIKKDDRVVMGTLFHSALSSGAGAATGSVGTYTIQNDGLTPSAADDVDRYLAATDLDAAGQKDLANLQAAPQGVGTGPLHLAAADLLLVVVNSVEAFATAGRVSGWLLVVRD